jgi:hypothetical protein
MEFQPEPRSIGDTVGGHMDPNSTMPSTIGRSFYSGSASPARLERIEEGQGFLHAGVQETPGMQVMLPTQEPPPEIIPHATNEPTPPSLAHLDSSNIIGRLEDCYQYVHYDEDVRGLGIHVKWGPPQPYAETVVESGESEKRGVTRGDIIAEVNGIETYGRTKDELLPLLGLRPLTMKIYRSSACASCGHYFLPNETICQNCNAMRPVCSCGQPLSPNAVFCRKCGAKQEINC